MATSSLLDTLVTPSWLADRLDDPEVKVLDASWYMPAMGRNGVAEFKVDRIPGSQFFDIDGISDPSQGLPHMLPSALAFGAAMDALGIREKDTVVLYDRAGVYSAPRAWWTFRVFGHANVAILNGGYPAWKAKGLPLDAAPAAEEALYAATQAAKEERGAKKGGYTAQLDESKVRSMRAVLRNIESQQEQVVDARSAGRFRGTEPEPRQGLRGGHIPGSKNIPFTSLVSDGRLKPNDQLSETFKAAGLDLEKPLVGSCGSGLTACIIALAYHQLTDKIMPIYDGSWMEWGSKEDVPIHTTEP